MSEHIILGAGGVIADQLAVNLILNNEKPKLVSRHPKDVPGAESFKADITDLNQTVQAIKKGSTVYLCIGLKYDYKVWRKQWPLIMDNVIIACSQSQSRLIFFDNVYMYGKVQGPMTEETPYNPTSKKGDLRARIATKLMSEVRKGNITASIARSADFYGPGAYKTSVANLLVFANQAKNKKAQWLVNDQVKHSFTFTSDAAKAMFLLAKDENSWNQVWHLPTASNPLTGKEFITQAAKAMGVEPHYTVLKKWILRSVGLFNKTIAESYELIYQSEFDYIFDSSKFEKAYKYQAVSYPEGISATSKDYKKDNP